MTRSGRSKTGTVVMDGLIEGPVPLVDGGEELLRRWVAATHAAGITFHLTMDGPRFSLLSDSEPIPVSEHDNLQDRIRQALENLLTIFPKDLWGRIFSTVRSIEHQEHAELQSLYVITSAGVDVRDRTVARRDEAPESSLPPVSYRSLLPYVITAIVVLCALIAAAFVVDIDPAGWWRKLRSEYAVLDAEEIAVDNATVSRYVAVKGISTDEKKENLLLDLERGPGWPADLAAYRAEERRIEQEGSLGELAALHRIIITGTLRGTYLDAHGTELAERSVSVRDLLEKPAVRVSLPVGKKRNIAKLRLEY